MNIRVMIAEDERLARDELAYLLAQEADVTFCPHAENGEQLLSLAKQHLPDVIFLDIDMPILSGMDAAQKMAQEAHAPLFVFTTAYDEYAVDAFGLEAVDYLLKPYDAARFRTALTRVRKQLAQTQAIAPVSANSPSVARSPGDPDSATEVDIGEVDVEGVNAKARVRGVEAKIGAQARMPAAPAVAGTVTPRPKGRLLIEEGEKMVILDPNNIVYAVRNDRFVHIHTTADDVVKAKMALRQLEQKLAGYPFFRPHRGYLVNLDYVQEITPWFNGAYNLLLKAPIKTKIPLSRNAAKELFVLLKR